MSFPGDSGLPPADDQQAKLLASLRARGGRPVTFAELRSRGIENPALLCYELEVAGLPIERVQTQRPEGPQPAAVLYGQKAGEDGSRAAGVEAPTERRWIAPPPGLLARSRARAMARPARPPAPRARDVRRRARDLRRRTGGDRQLPAGRIPSWALLAALALIVLTAAWRALADLGGSSARAPASARAGTIKRMRPATSGAPASGASRAAPQPQTATTTASSPSATTAAPPAGSAAQMQASGHQLLAEGRYAPAMSDLRAALASSGQSASSCTQPSSEACLTYAYALYDLGHALRLDGAPHAAEQVLSQRLRIDDQRATVAQELALAAAEARTGAPPAPLGGGGTAPARGRRGGHLHGRPFAPSGPLGQGAAPGPAGGDRGAPQVGDTGGTSPVGD